MFVQWIKDRDLDFDGRWGQGKTRGGVEGVLKMSATVRCAFQKAGLCRVGRRAHRDPQTRDNRGMKADPGNRSPKARRSFWNEGPSDFPAFTRAVPSTLNEGRFYLSVYGNPDRAPRQGSSPGFPNHRLLLPLSPPRNTLVGPVTIRTVNAGLWRGFLVLRRGCRSLKVPAEEAQEDRGEAAVLARTCPWPLPVLSCFPAKPVFPRLLPSQYKVQAWARHSIVDGWMRPCAASW